MSSTDHSETLLGEQGGAPSTRQNRAEKPSLLGATRAEIAAACRSLGVPEREIKMRTGQLWHWIYFQGATSFDVMANIGKTLRTALAENFSLPRPQLVTE